MNLASRRPIGALPLARRVLFALSLVGLASTAAAQSDADYFNERAKAATRAATPAEELPHLVELKSRVFKPKKSAPIDFSGGRTLVYLQFETPPTVAERQKLILQGVRIYGAIDQHTYVVRLSEGHHGQLLGDTKVRGFEPVAYADRLTENLFRGTAPTHALDRDGKWIVYVKFYEDVSHRHALFVLDRLGLAVEDRREMLYGNTTIVHGRWEELLALSDSPTVRNMWERPGPDGVYNQTSQAIANVDDIQGAPYSLDGSGVIMGIWDEGKVVDTHTDMTGRVTNIDDNGTFGDHSTHVAGTMVGDGTNSATAEGMAPNATLFSWDFTDGTPWSEMSIAAGVQGIVVSNHSWGRTLGWDGTPATDSGNAGQFGNYDNLSSSWDQAVRGTDLIVVKAAGNDRDDCDPNNSANCDGDPGDDGQSYGNIGPRAVAKNVITVGAIGDSETGTNSISGFSSAGPADDGRIKPDVVANGVSLTSTWAGGTTIPSMNCDGQTYCSIGGTSMASPSVSGMIADLIQHYRALNFGNDPSAAAMKALVVNTARDRGRPGPDFLYGFGLVDGLAAAETLDAGQVRIYEDSVGTGEEDEVLMIVPGGTGPLKATLVWIDPGGPDNGAAPDIINNLDLELISPANVVAYPFSGPGTGNADFDELATNSGPNTVDTVEQMVANSPIQGIWRVRVRGTAVPDGPQNYALVVSHALSLEDEPNIVVNAPLDFFETCFDGFQDIEVSIFNTGGAPLFVNDVSLVASSVFELLTPPAPPFIVPAGSHVDVTVRFAPIAGAHVPGDYSGFLQIDSNDADEPVLLLPMTGSIGIGDLKTSLEANGNFGCVKLGDFRTLEYQIINEGTCDLTLTDLTRTAGSAEFTLGEQPGSMIFPITLFPGENIQVQFKYEPTDFTFDTSSWTLATDDPDTPTRLFQLQGRCMPPDIAITGSTDFGVVCPDEQAEKVLDICNLGKSDLEVTSVAFVAPCPDFTLINSPYPPDAPVAFTPVSHDFCLGVTIRYTPTTVGDHTCTLRILSNDPDEPVVEVLVTGTTPPVVVDVPDDLELPPTVTQQVDPICESYFAFPITNTGLCDVEITNVEIVPPVGGDANFDDYSLEPLPAFPLTLQPGHRLGNGFLKVFFRPTAVRHQIHSRVEITYVSHVPNVGDETTVYVNLCGEGVNTGGRLLVKKNGIPVPHIDKLTLWQIYDYGEPHQSALAIEVVTDVDLKTVADSPPCTGFQYHHEWGGETNPIVLPPGWYRAESAIGTESPTDRSVLFYLPDTCTFLPDLCIDYP